MTGTKKLPGNHGQFGMGDATEDYKELPDYVPPASPATPAPATPAPATPEGNRGEGGGGDSGGGGDGGGEGG